MKLSKKRLGVLVGAALGLGVAGQASADVYGLGYLAVDNLVVQVDVVSGSATSFIFTTDQNAALNNVADPTDGSNTCFGFFPGDTSDCGTQTPVLSGTVQNAPGSVVTATRGEDDYTKYGSPNGNYSSAEAAIITAALLLIDPSTSTKAISESNLDTAVSASATTTVQSNTNLQWTFRVADGGAFSIAFDAVVDALSQVTDGDLGIAQGNTGLTVLLQSAGQTLASWVPRGVSGALTGANCGVGLTCTSTESATSLNNTTSSSGAANQVAGSGSYRLDVTGLASGDYTLALANTTSTQLVRRPVPVPGTLLLLGAGLLAGTRTLRRNKS